MRTIKVFLASSSELADERTAFREFISSENDRLHTKGIYLEIVQWDYFLDSVSHNGLQKEYNAALLKCDILVCLFWTKAGKYTREEFNTGLEQFKATGKPSIYVYFKNVPDPNPEQDPEPKSDFDAFKMRLHEIGHFPTLFSHVDTLKLHFIRQLDRIFEKDGLRDTLPNTLSADLFSEKSNWVQSLSDDLQEMGAEVSTSPSSVFRHFGWLIESTLQKMMTPVGRKRDLRSLEFMTEAYRSSVQYLAYIQLSQLLQDGENPGANMLVQSFLSRKQAEVKEIDFLDFLVQLTSVLKPETHFVPEIATLVSRIAESDSDLYQTVLYLDQTRNQLVQDEIDSEKLDQILDEYLTALVYWLRQLVFLANYRLISIKDISLNYRLGFPKRYIHHYGELHGIYAQGGNADVPDKKETISDSLDSQKKESDYKKTELEDFFTFNQSVILFKGNNLHDMNGEESLSLSPLIIDQSVFSEKHTQTPEVYAYLGYENRAYQYGHYKNELQFQEKDKTKSQSNKYLLVKQQNNNMPLLNKLFKQIELLVKPFKSQNR
jgi:hypothetical protein